MSQENQNIQPSSDSVTPPSWKTALAKTLRNTINVLENTAVKLETSTPSDSEDKPGIWQKLQQGWSVILGKIRLILPAKFSAKLSDPALTGIFAGLILIIFLTTSNISTRKPVEIAVVPSNTEIPAVISTTEPESIVSPEPEAEIILKPEQQTPSLVEQKKSPGQEIASLATEEESIPIVEQKNLAQEKTITEEQQIPANIESLETIPPQEAQPQKEIETNPLPLKAETPPEELEINPQPLLLTPEETLITAIQDRLADINVIPKTAKSTENNFSEIIDSIQASFLDSNLTIKLSNDWYKLDKPQQNELAAKILQRSQELDFTHLEITDLKGKQIARNPVVGSEMIILKRE